MVDLRIDDIDLKIIKELYTTEITCTSTNLTKIIFKDLKDYRELVCKNSNIIRRMEKLSRYGFLICSKEKNTKMYLVNPDKVIYGVGRMIIKAKTKDKQIFKFDNIIMLKPNGFWISYQLN